MVKALKRREIADKSPIGSPKLLSHVDHLIEADFWPSIPVCYPCFTIARTAW